MNYSVEWKKTATGASDADRLLESDPYVNSESRDADRRIMFVDPLAITFRVDSDADKVEVLRVRKFG